MKYRFHLLSVPHAITCPEYSACAFTQKVLKMAKMLTDRGHDVFHYGAEGSRLQCTEHITVTTAADMEQSYPDHDFQTSGFPKYAQTDHIYEQFRRNTNAELFRRKEKNDFLLCTFGGNHKPISDHHADMIVVEPGIGYPSGGFAPFRVYESYAILHAYLGMPNVEKTFNDRWYDAVIPNYFDLNDFEYSEQWDKDDYLLFLGRVYSGKGVQIAIQIAEEIGAKLICAGVGSIDQSMARTSRPISEYVSHVGQVQPAERKKLLSRAKAVICPSQFVEPFCGVQIEAFLSGTPVISCDYGAFAEYNLHGITGYRCHTFDHFVWAAKNISNISPHACRKWGENFSIERVGEMFEEYWSIVMDVHAGKGWYEPHPERSNLNWLTRT